MHLCHDNISAHWPMDTAAALHTCLHLPAAVCRCPAARHPVKSYISKSGQAPAVEGKLHVSAQVQCRQLPVSTLELAVL